jgi:uncharacterized protein (DUF3084 family)
MTMSPTFTIDIQVTGVSHSKREAIVSASPAGRTYVERVCKSEALWDYDTDIHPGWASVHVRCVDHNGRSVTAEKLACILASESDTPVAFVRDIEGETAEVIEPGMDVKAERDALTKRQPQ